MVKTLELSLRMGRSSHAGDVLKDVIRFEFYLPLARVLSLEWDRTLARFSIRLFGPGCSERKFAQPVSPTPRQLRISKIEYG